MDLCVVSVHVYCSVHIAVPSFYLYHIYRPKINLQDIKSKFSFAVQYS